MRLPTPSEPDMCFDCGEDKPLYLVCGGDHDDHVHACGDCLAKVLAGDDEQTHTFVLHADEPRSAVRVTLEDGSLQVMGLQRDLVISPSTSDTVWISLYED